MGCIRRVVVLQSTTNLNPMHDLFCPGHKNKRILCVASGHSILNTCIEEKIFDVADQRPLILL